MSTPILGQLRLTFSQAADRARVKAMFSPAVKDRIDPQGHVARRDNALLDAHIDNGHAAMLVDDSGDVHTLAIAWHLSAADDKSARTRHIEVGSAMTRLPGFHSANPVIAALALSEWWKPTVARGLIAAEVSNDNMPSQKLFRDKLGWKPVTDKNILKNINELSYAGVVGYDHTADPKTWYKADRDVRQKQAQIILDFIKRGSLLNAISGHAIKLDITSAMNDAGLPISRLEALADGSAHTKKALKAIPG